MKYMKAFLLAKDHADFNRRAKNINPHITKGNLSRRYFEAKDVSDYMDERTKEILGMLNDSGVEREIIISISDKYLKKDKRVPAQYEFNFDIFKGEKKEPNKKAVEKKESPYEFLPRRKQLTIQDLIKWSKITKKKISYTTLVGEGFTREEIEQLKEKGVLDTHW